MPLRYWRRALKTAPWLQRLCSRIWWPSTPDPGVESWIASLRASRASRTLSLESVVDTTTSEPSGRTSFESFRECEPALAFLENTPDFLNHFEPVWRELRGLGFVLPPPLLHTASELGAPHIRRRLFVLAAHPDRCDLRNEPGRLGWTNGAGAAEPRHAGHGPTDADDTWRWQPRDAQPGDSEGALERWRAPEHRGCGGATPHTDRLVGSADLAESDAGPDGRRHAHGGSGVAPDPNGRGLAVEWSGWVFDPERQTLRHGQGILDWFCKHRGLGALEVLTPGYETQAPVRERIAPKLCRRIYGRLKDCLREEQKTFAAAGNAEGRRYTPWRATCQEVERFARRNPGATLRELVEGIDHHYSTTATARSSLVKWIRLEKVPGVRLNEEARPARVFPVSEVR